MLLIDSVFNVQVVSMQEQGLGERHRRQHAKGGAPAEGVGNQHADGDAEYRGRDDAEGNQEGRANTPSSAASISVPPRDASVASTASPKR